MLLCILLLGTVLSLPTDHLRSSIHKGDPSRNDSAFVKQNISSGHTPQILSVEDLNSYRMVPNVFDKDNKHFKTFFSYVVKGVTEKGLIFNLYEEDIRNATEALFSLFRETRLYNKTDYNKIKEWANINVNDDMLDYIKRLISLYSNSDISEDILLPPFLAKPNYFVNGEAIVKALYIKNNFEKISDTVLKNYQAEKLTNNTIVVNTNYSGWNLPLNGCDAHISYFKDDVALNSYYYGVHLLHPFWMSNDELDKINPDHAEHYYFVHQQLLARFYLEKGYLKKKIIQYILTSHCNFDYNPYLYYENGLAFPTRSGGLGNVDERMNYIKSLDHNIRNHMSQSLHFMGKRLYFIETQNGTYIEVTPDNYINLMTKYVRLGVDGIKSATVLRSVFGYGSNGYPVSMRNPTPSAMHHPQTTLRDPAYWLMIEKGLDYFFHYLNTTRYNLSVYETNEINISGAQFSKITTIFEYFYVNLRKALDNTKVNSDINVNIFSRQRRLNHLPFTLNFTVESKTRKDVIVRLFLGPQCEINECWNLHLGFFELDCYRYKLDEGLNTVTWSPQNSKRYSNHKKENYADYNIYEFPQNLIIPKGLKEGLNLTIFIMITENLGPNDTNYSSTRSFYHKISNKLDNKPLGFPFHKKVQFSDGFGTKAASNYKFFNFTVFHRKDSVDEKSGYFSPNLY